MNRKSFYILFSVVCLISYVWLFFNIQSQSTSTHTLSVCMFKNITSVPCPACGTTTSVLSLLAGDFQQAIMTNPSGIIAAFLLLVIPLWLLNDALFKKASLFNFYVKSENFIKQKYVAALLFTAVLSNWVWTIIKEI